MAYSLIVHGACRGLGVGSCAASFAIAENKKPKLCGSYYIGHGTANFAYHVAVVRGVLHIRGLSFKDIALTIKTNNISVLSTAKGPFHSNDQYREKATPREQRLQNLYEFEHALLRFCNVETEQISGESINYLRELNNKSIIQKKGMDTFEKDLFKNRGIDLDAVYL